MCHLKSLREYIAALQEIGELQQIDKQVDLKYEIGAISLPKRSSFRGAFSPELQQKVLDSWNDYGFKT